MKLSCLRKSWQRQVRSTQVCLYLSFYALLMTLQFACPGELPHVVDLFCVVCVETFLLPNSSCHFWNLPIYGNLRVVTAMQSLYQEWCK